ncbi:MAG TPA: WYL domain-containing protein [Actinomycetota bacterium]|nr:WYL domain-containing protein [Actinomycetota bacterium]
MRRIERLINLIAALLETRRPLSAEEIRDRIQGYDQETHEAFRRAFERDKETLRALGIPIETRKVDPLYDASPDGYVIPKDRYYLPELDLEADEAAALRIAAEAMVGSGDAARAGLMKLDIDDPASSGGPRFVWGADVASEQPYLPPLYESVLRRTPVRFGYRGAAADDVRTRTVEPYRVVHRRGHWYVVGRDRDKDALRAFKLSRIQGGLKVLEGTYEIPKGFDASSHLPREGWEVGADPDVVAVLRFDPELRWWAEQNLRPSESAEGPGGALDVRIPVANLDALVSWVIGLGERVEILEPDAARARVVEHLEAWL